MCGILGFYSPVLTTSLKKEIRSSVKSLSHRGPDDKGFVLKKTKDGNVMLAHTRLSIIDLSKSANQPMVSNSGRFILSFNGEIYNYKEIRTFLEQNGYNFATSSDTEVLLNAWEFWGEDCLKKLTGMFAFAIFDQRDEILHLVRDAFGIKPLFYSFKNQTFFFSSEIGALFKFSQLHRAPNFQSVFDYLTLSRVDRGEETFFESVKHLLPGHKMKFVIGQKPTLEISRWWNPKITENLEISFDHASERLRELFLKSVSLHTRSDVPIGATLSGGIDSSAIVCCIRELNPEVPINTFSYLARNSPKNEERWINLVNRKVNANPHFITLEKDDLNSDLKKLIKLQGEPFGSTSIYAQFRVFNKCNELGIKVTLDGQGADEMLAGYHGYPEERFKSLIANYELVEIYRFYKSIKNSKGNFANQVFLNALKSFFDCKNPSFTKQVDFANQYLSNNFPYKSFFCNQKNLSHRNQRSLMEALRNSLTGKKGLVHLLRYEDRNSMFHSIESRVPFLNTEIAEFTLTLPEKFLISNDFKTKNIFRHAMRDIVPVEILQRKDKIGFETPHSKWVSPQIKIIKKWINKFDEIPMLSSKKVNHYLDNHFNKRKNHISLELWRMINYYHWYRINF